MLEWHVSHGSGQVPPLWVNSPTAPPTPTPHLDIAFSAGWFLLVLHVLVYSIIQLKFRNAVGLQLVNDSLLIYIGHMCLGPWISRIPISKPIALQWCREPCHKGSPFCRLPVAHLHNARCRSLICWCLIWINYIYIYIYISIISYYIISNYGWLMLLAFAGKIREFELDGFFLDRDDLFERSNHPGLLIVSCIGTVEVFASSYIILSAWPEISWDSLCRFTSCSRSPKSIVGFRIEQTLCFLLLSSSLLSILDGRMTLTITNQSSNWRTHRWAVHVSNAVRHQSHHRGHWLHTSLGRTATWLGGDYREALGLVHRLI